jgi:hypothetical protein
MIACMPPLFSLVLVALIAPAVHAVDLTKIERTIAKEPAYAGKPKYCLLVFGPEAKTRIWLALDGDKLYVDKNGNGDLTDDGPPIAAKTDGEGDNIGYSFVVPEIHDGKLVHKQLALYTFPLTRSGDRDPESKALLARDPAARGCLLSIDVETPDRKGNGLGGRLEYSAASDGNGRIQFSTTPREAPIIHFGGPWSIMFYSQDDLLVGRESDFVLAIGTPGLGPGTTAFVAYEGLVPDGLIPMAEIAFPPKAPGEPPIKKLFELKERC